MTTQRADLHRIASVLDLGAAALTICKIADGVALAGPTFDGVAAYHVLAGSMHLLLPCGSTHVVHSGSIALIPAGQASEISSGAAVEGPAIEGQNMVARAGPWLVADATQGRTLRLTVAAARIAGTTSNCLSRITIVPLGRDRVGRKLSAMLRSEVSDPGVANGALAIAMMTGCIIIALRNAAAATDDPVEVRGTHSLIDRAVVAIRADPGGAHTIDSLSSVAGMSRATFRRQFARAMRMSPMQFVLHTRLTEAATILSNGSQSVKAIAAQTGFASRSHFSRSFRKAFGRDPTSFRQESGLAIDGE